MTVRAAAAAAVAVAARAAAKVGLAGCVALAAFVGPAGAQRTPIASVHPLPPDLAPRVGLEQCGDFVGHFGPLDFRKIHPLDRRNVENNHFDQELRTFLAGQLKGKNRSGVGDVMGGFNYTLKAIPNHPAALLVVEQLGRKLKTDDFGEYPLECYFMRAFMIAPDDPVVRAMYGIYLGHRGRQAEALVNLKTADENTHDKGVVQYHIGLAYVELKRWDLAQANAMRAARLQFPLDALEKSIRQAGKWNDAMVLPPEAVTPDDDAASTAGLSPEKTASSSATSPAPAASAAAAP